MKAIKNLATVFGLILFATSLLFSQEAMEEKKPVKPVRNTFESNWFMDNQTVIVPIKGTFEMDILHRFGTFDKGFENFYGLFDPSNIKLGFSYVPIDNIQVGIGMTKERNVLDLNLKYALLKQGRSGGSPLSLTYYVDMGIETLQEEDYDASIIERDLVDNARLSYFHQLMVARKFSKEFSAQASLSIAHFNIANSYIDAEGIKTNMKNDQVTAGVLVRYKMTDVTSLMVEYDYPLTDHGLGNPGPHPNVYDPEFNLSFGLEFTSSAHAFQVFAGNYYYILPQYNSFRNSSNSEYRIGFNITRMWNF